MTLRTLVLCCFVDLVLGGHFTNEWAVDIQGGREAADRVAKELNCVNQGEILPDTYLFVHRHVAKRSVDPAASTHSEISDHPSIDFAEQQQVLSRKKRQLWSLPQMMQPQMMQQQQQQPYTDLVHMNDQRWPQMWYMNRGGRLDMNVQDAWLEGATGKGIHVTILDDGIEKSHPDLLANYDPMSSFDVNENDNDPTPRYDIIDSNRHGTRCAGEVAATANNSICAVGIAYEAGIGGVRMLDGDVTDAVEARSLGLNNQHIDIYSASWGPDDDGKTVDGPGRLASRAFLQGIQGGRGGKGSIFVWASGNGGRDHDNCNCDGYTNSVWTLSVSSATENGLIPWYSEACSSSMAATYSSGSSGERKVVTTDLHHGCTSTHTGTSASAPLAAGIIALTLHANPDLTWRDVQHITIRCAHSANLKASDWATNAVGRNFSHSFGYGIMDATCMVRLAKQWTTVPEQQRCTRTGDKVDMMVPGRSKSKSQIEVTDCDGVKFLEHVQVHVTLSATRRGDVSIYLVSPSGTATNLLAKRPRDYSRAGFNDWPFLSVHMWEESPIGTWMIEIINEGRSIVELKEWKLVFLGTSTHPQPNAPAPTPSPAPPAPKPTVKVPDVKPQTPAPAVGPAVGPTVKPVADPHQMSAAVRGLENCKEEERSDWCAVCQDGFLLMDGRCVKTCPVEGFFQSKDACLKCYYTCKTCDGGNDYQCLSCFGDAKLDEESPTQKFCHNKSLIDRALSSERWNSIVFISFMVMVAVAFGLIFIIWRRSRSAAKPSPIREAARRNSSLYSPVKKNGSAKAGAGSFGSSAAIPFHDADSSSENEELFRKPFRDDPTKLV